MSKECNKHTKIPDLDKLVICSEPRKYLPGNKKGLHHNKEDNLFLD